MRTTVRAPRRRHLVVASVLALTVVTTTGWLWHQERTEVSLQDTVEADGARGSVADDATCRPVRSQPVGDAGAHIDRGRITYRSAPPAFGDHRSRWEVGALSFYDPEDRPEVAVLVHNLEHGYNILWYDEVVARDAEALARVREIARGYATLGESRDPATAFIAAPWTAEDGDPFPAGTHYALTHWYADPTDRTASRSDELGLTRHCTAISAALVQEWMTDYPLSDAPEGYPDLM